MKKCCFRDSSNWTLRETAIATKKAPAGALFYYWCALLCDYVRALHYSPASGRLRRLSCAEHFRRYDSGLKITMNIGSWSIKLLL